MNNLDVKSTQLSDGLSKRWQLLWPVLTADVISSTFCLIESHYREKHRAYHTLEHIQACLSHLDCQDVNPDKRRELELAIWFHDVIYSPYKSNNEALSAELAVATLPRLSEKKETISRVSDLILLTKHPSIPETAQEQLMLDIDLSILGSDPQLYSQYEDWIRQEYQWVPGVVYRKRRIKLLQQFMSQPTIYHTEVFQDKREKQARRNIKWAIAQLN